jgi:hypothetical protein
MLDCLFGPRKMRLHGQRKPPCKKMTSLAAHEMEKRAFRDRWQIRALKINGETTSSSVCDRTVSTI